MTKTDERVKVNFVLTTTSSYCGGARPTEEITRDLSTPKPLEGIRIFIGRGKVNDGGHLLEDVVFTDKNGTANILLPEGDYFFVFENRANDKLYEKWKDVYANETPNYSAVDQACLKTWFETPEWTFEVKGNETNIVNYNVHKPCEWNSIPCIDYRGAYPP